MDEREEKILELRAYFWMQFRVYDEDEIDLDDPYSDDYELDDFPSFSETTLEEMRADFAAVNALDEFYRLYLDYNQDELAVQKKRLAKKLDAIDLEIEEAINSMKKSKRREHIENYIKKLHKKKRKMVEDSLVSQNTAEAEIALCKRELEAMGFVGPKYKKMKKSKVTIQPTGIVNGKVGAKNYNVTKNDNEINALEMDK